MTIVPDDDAPDGSPRTDRQLLAAHVEGDPAAFAELVARHRDRLWAVAMRTLGEHEEAADALQDALISAYRGAAGFRGDAAVTTWLHRVVVNACLDRLRRARSRPTVPLLDTEPADVRAALARLPEHQRAALVLVDLHAMSVAEAAAVLQVAEGTVKSRCARGRAALAALLRPQGPPPGNRRAVRGVPPAFPLPDTEGGSR